MSRLRLAGLVLVLVGLVAWWAWPRPDEADRVRAAILAVIAGAEAGDAGDVLAPLADDFVAVSDGTELGRDAVRTLVTAQLMRRGPLLIVPGTIDVQLDGARATASFDALLTESSPKWTVILPVDADGWHLDVELRKRDDEWEVVRAERSDP